MQFDFDVTIDRPVSDVFAYVTDVRNVPEWQESAESAEWLEEGKVFRERRQFMGRAAELTLKVVALEPDRRFDVRTVRSPVSFEIRHSFEARDGGTLLHVQGKAELGGMLRFAAGMAKRQAERQFRSDFERLKAVLERRDEESPSDRPPRLAGE
jgi:uncharacterized membrane protein